MSLDEKMLTDKERKEMESLPLKEQEKMMLASPLNHEPAKSGITQWFKNASPVIIGGAVVGGITALVLRKVLRKP